MSLRLHSRILNLMERKLTLELGYEPSVAELAEALETSAKELLSWLGEGKRQKKELRNKFEKYFGEDGKTYIRRKGAQECSQP